MEYVLGGDFFADDQASGFLLPGLTIDVKEMFSFTGVDTHPK